MSSPSTSSRTTRLTAPGWTYAATLRRVVDGDTLDLLVDVGFDCAVKVRVRVADVNTPEVRGAEREAGLASKALVEAWIKPGDAVVLRSFKGRRSFARWVGDVSFSHQGELHDLRAALIDAGAGEAV